MEFFVGTGLLAFFAAAATFFYRWVRDRDDQKHLSREIEGIRAALLGELEDLREAFSTDAEIRDQVLVRVDEDNDFVPFLPQLAIHPVYSALLPRIGTLGRGTSFRVSRAYGQMIRLESFRSEIMDKSREKIPRERLRNILVDYLDMLSFASILIDEAIASLIHGDNRG